MRSPGQIRRYALCAILLVAGSVLFVQRYAASREAEQIARVEQEAEARQAARRERQIAEVKAQQIEFARRKPELDRQEAERAAIEAEKARIGTIATLEPEEWTLTVVRTSDEQRPFVAMLSGLRSADPQKPQQRCDVLAHEIVRQAWLMALRDGLGMRTRDESLGESLPTETEMQPSTSQLPALEVHARVARDQVEVVLMRRRENQPPIEVWRHVTPAEPKPTMDYVALIKLAEKWSREDFVEALKQQGLAAVEPLEAADTALDEETAKRISRLNDLDQFVAIGDVHRAIEEQGASAELVGALVRTYANLGLLTEFHWSSAHKALKARAALYAQRLCQERPTSPWGPWHRSYAFALTGLHKQALDDLAVAETLADNAGDHDDAEPPAWIDVINAYCHFDTAQLAGLPVDADLQQLTAMLRFLTIEAPETTAYTIKTGMDVLQKNPDNFRMVDALCDVGGVSNLHRMTALGPAVLRAILLQRLPQMPELPDEIVESLKQAVHKRTLDEAEFVQQLSAAGRADRREPSWTAFARIVSELHFVHVWRRAYFMRFQWSVPTDEYLQQSWPLVAHHPHRRHVEQILYDVNRARETAADILPRLDRMALSVTKQAEVAKLLLQCRVDPEEHREMVMKHSLQADEVYPELAAMSRMIRDHRINNLKQRLEVVSPHGLQTSVLQVSLGNLDHVQDTARLYRQRPAVLRKLATRLNRPDYQAEHRQVLRDYLRFSPDAWGYLRLAKTYKEAGDVPKWKEVLDEYLDSTEPTLEHARVRVEIAQDFMSRQQWQRAEPYAAEAATSYAAWAMHCAIQCYEGMGDLKQAQVWFARLAERYPRHAPQYAAWCQQHGLEPPQAAKADPAQLEELLDSVPPEQLFVLGAQFLMRSEWEAALSVFQKAHVANKDARARCFNGMFTVLLAEQLAKPELRDQTLRNVAETSDPVQVKSRRLAEWLQQTLAGDPLSAPDMAPVDELLQDASIEDQVNLNYFVGRFLELRGHADTSREYYTRATKVKGGETFLTHRLALAAVAPAEESTDEVAPMP